MAQTKAVRIFLSILLSIVFWSLFFLTLYALAFYEYAYLILMGLLILAVTAKIVYEILETNEEDKRDLRSYEGDYNGRNDAR